MTREKRWLISVEWSACVLKQDTCSALCPAHGYLASSCDRLRLERSATAREREVPAGIYCTPAAFWSNL